MGFFAGWTGEWERVVKVKNRVEGVGSRGYIEEADEGKKGGGGRAPKRDVVDKEAFVRKNICNIWERVSTKD
jgi:hypothetical protein